MDSEDAIAGVEKASRARQAIEVKMQAARDTQYAAIRAALDAEVTVYAIAKASGLTQRAVRRIRDGEIG